jgi:hypothetical protein
MRVSAKYVTEFTIKNGKIRSSRVINGENANVAQLAAIKAAKPLLAAFVRSRLTSEIQHQDCMVNVRVGYIETPHGLELTFKV